MKLVERYEELSPLLSAQLRRGVATNAALTPEDWRREIANRALWYHDWEGGLVLLRRREGHSLMNFYLREMAVPDGLRWDGPTVLEIAARPQDQALVQAAELWRLQGFREQFRRVRMARPKGVELPAKSTLPVRLASLADEETIAGFLNHNYHPAMGWLPTGQELERDLAEGNVVCAEAPDGSVVGMLRFTPGRAVVQFHHLVVVEQYRHQGIAQSLFSDVLNRHGWPRSLLWVRQDNDLGQRLYARMGYAADGWSSTVLYRP